MAMCHGMFGARVRVGREEDLDAVLERRLDGSELGTAGMSVVVHAASMHLGVLVPCGMCAGALVLTV